ncbi:hypothetical protein IQ273_01770 [Nodosilinea sp. LEGE 07298]|uniref:hypothetical protein n=1 Tax=Nodosilinea sp. LEGE 07298 TaxID=2777970 RepID=UPI00187F50E6|nr:hypothetical protein [Nodosilinea sp. LEGE 07298]MBE9108150.1 hypothetical protein [Nodosilinea sp. LEGE 07298]
MKDRNRLLCIALTACAVPLWWVMLGVPSLAQGRPLRQEVRLEAAQAGTVPITVWPGSGANLDFSRLGLRIYRAWLDDPSKLTIDFDAPLDAGGAQVVHLRRIKGVSFQGLPSAPATLLSVVARDASGTAHLFQFPIAYGSGSADYSTIAVVPAPASVGPRAMIQASTIPGQGANPLTFSHGIAALIEAGTIAPNGPMHQSLRAFLALITNGVPVAEASAQTGVSLEVVQAVVMRGLEQQRQSILRPGGAPEDADAAPFDPAEAAGGDE